MTWISDFDDELAARRIRPSVRERLVAEFEDHIACEQGVSTRIALTHLGVAREIAGQCADELAADDVRSGALRGFGALTLAAVATVGSQAALGSIGYPGFNHGASAALGLVAIAAFFLGAQVALVAGTLAAWRAFRRRREAVLPAAEVALLRRRALVGVGAGIVTTAGLLLYVVDFIGVLPAWWLALSGSLAALAAGSLLVVTAGLVRTSSTVVLASGPAGDLFDDLPPLRPLRGHPVRLCAATALVIGTAMTLFEWHAEHSLTEGLQRGIFEALAMTAGFALLGRAIGARR
jgi:hypothetical protein